MLTFLRRNTKEFFQFPESTSLEVKWRDPIRAGKVTANDGGQRYDWPHHNGATSDVAQWEKQNPVWKTGEILLVGDDGNKMYVKADCTKAYSDKVESFIREIYFARPGEFTIIDTIRVKDPAFKVIWGLQAMAIPEKTGDGKLTWDNRKARITFETFVEQKTKTELFHGDKLYEIDGINYPPARDTGPAPVCRIEITPVEQAKEYVFVNVLTVGEK